ncbi:MAG: winged helix-turn-helix transcriptional regulator [Candidatus Omnitrophica bacterium]|nr:winged helix-turn-helix transcriptional regulator [Candidatus Omnitrophota bacterium]
MEELAYKIKSDFLRVLAHPLRLQIIELLKRQEEKVGGIAKGLNIPQSSLSRHLLALREAGILKSRQQGTVIYYAIEDKGIFRVLRPIAEMLRKKLEKTATVLTSLGKEK